MAIKERLLSEVVLCGGLLSTRKRLYEELLAEGLPRKQVDAFVFGYLRQVVHTPAMWEYDGLLRENLAAEKQPREREQE